MAQPLPSPPLRQLAPASVSHETTTATRQKPARRTEAKISSACLTCKQKRTKCSGAPSPCQLCKELKTECVFDSSLDQRRKIAGHRRDQELKSQTQMVDGLFEVIRSGGERQVQDLLELIRADAPMAEIAAAVEETLETSQPGQKRKWSVSESGSSARGVAHTGQLPTESPSSSIGQASVLSIHHPNLGFSERASWHPSLQLPSSQDSNLSTGQGQSLESQVQSSRFVGQNVTYEEMQHSSSWHQSFLNDDATPAEELAQVVEGLDTMSDPQSPSSNTRRLRDLRRQLDQLQRRPYPAPGYVEVFGNLPMSSAVMTNSYPREVQIQQLCSFRLPVHLIQSLITIDNSALARVFTDYRDAARRLLVAGTQAKEPNFTAVDLFFRDRLPTDPHTASYWACELCKTFGEWPVSMQLACMYLLTYLMRWTINPTAETYRAMPKMIRPTPFQRLIPHVAPIDMCTLAPVRDAMTIKLRDFVTTIFEANVSCNWPYSLNDCFELDADSGQRKLTARFEEHASNIDNWSVGKRFFDTFPELVGQIRVNEINDP